jgi:putative cro repressor|nr:MAG TPA: Protein of unknown function (DUF739) [Caudoviricetes sp.]
MNYDYSKLNGRIIEICKTQANFASRMGLSERSISLKLNNRIPFNQVEIDRAISVLGIVDTEIPNYFFKKEVQKN